MAISIKYQTTVNMVNIYSSKPPVSKWTSLICSFYRLPCPYVLWKILLYIKILITLYILPTDGASFFYPTCANARWHRFPSVCLGLWGLRCAPPRGYRTMLCTTDLRCAPPGSVVHHGAQGGLCPSEVGVAPDIFHFSWFIRDDIKSFGKISIFS